MCVCVCVCVSAFSNFNQRHLSLNGVLTSAWLPNTSEQEHPKRTFNLSHITFTHAEKKSLDVKLSFENLLDKGLKINLTLLELLPLC